MPLQAYVLEVEVAEEDLDGIPIDRLAEEAVCIGFEKMAKGGIPACWSLRKLNGGPLTLLEEHETEKGQPRHRPP